MFDKPVNRAAIGVCVILQQAVGAGWYAIFESEWLAAIGKSPDDITMDTNAVAVALAIAASLLSSWFIARLLVAFDTKGPAKGITISVLLWIAVILPYTAHHNAFAQLPTALTMIDAGKDLVAYALTGAVLAAWPSSKN